jgi:hypothetical protein
MKFRVGGIDHEIDREMVIRTMSRKEPESIRTHLVEIENRQFPPKQVFEAVTGMDRLDFTVAQARHVLQRLGFELRRSS